MKRAKLLLKASRTMIGEGNRIALGLFTGMVWVFLAIAVFGITFGMIEYKGNLENLLYIGKFNMQMSAMIIAYGLVSSCYTGFMEVKNDSSKSSFNKFAIQLPVTREDVIKAQFLDLLQCAFPGLILVGYMVIVAFIVGIDTIIIRYIGVLNLFFIVLFLIICLEKGVFTYVFIDDKVRQYFYMSFALVSVGVGVMPRSLQEDVNQYLSVTMELGNVGISHYLSSGLEFLGGLGGLLSLCIAGVIGYYLSCYLPIKISSLREESK